MLRFLLFLFLYPFAVEGQTPGKISFQAVVYDNQNKLVVNKNVGVRMSIISESVEGTIEYQETHLVTTSGTGLFTLQIGGGTPTIGAFTAINWGEAPHFLKREFDINGGTNYQISGIGEILSVPYALYAKSAENIGGSIGLPGQQLIIDENGLPKWSGAAYPSVSTISISSISATSAVININITSNGGQNVSSRGVVYNTSDPPTLANFSKVNGSGIGSFNVTINDLTPNTTYFVRGFGTNSVGTGYGSSLMFTTSAPTIPLLSTNAVTSITQNTAISGGVINSNGGSNINQRGVVWNTSTNPTISNNKTTDGMGTGNFNSNLTGLLDNTKYYIRSYATNSVGTAYGNELTFTTASQTVPILTTNNILNITNVSASSGGSITSNGGSPVTAKGIVWSTNPNPTLSDNKTNDGSGTTSFNSVLTGLMAGTTYYVRSYATNMAGTGYGEQKSFTTASIASTIANIVLDSIGSIGTTSFIAYANVVDEGGGPVTERGIVWSASPGPNLDDNRISSGNGTGNFSVHINSGLQSNFQYYLKAYAINNFDIAFSNEFSVTTSQGLASVETFNTIPYKNSATSGGNIIEWGGSPVTQRGVVWSINQNPTILDDKTIDGEGTGAFTSNLTNLSPNTKYFIRAYAINSSGISYGNERNFTTTDESLTITDIDGNVYNTVQIGTQFWMAENLKTTKYKNGTPIPYIIGKNEWSNLTTGAWSYYDYDISKNSLFGKLYNWYSVEGDSICPNGWHIPSDTEWMELRNFLGGEDSAGGKMKQIGTEFWKSPNSQGTNESGFNALPAGNKGNDGIFNYETEYAFFWQKNDKNLTGTWYYFLIFSDGFLKRNDGNKTFGFSVRCLKD